MYQNNMRKKFKSKQQNTKKNEDLINEKNPIISMFKDIATKLDEKHDRYERIVKISRDITIESKRIIFLLHTIDLRNEESSQQIFTSAKTRLDNLIEKNFIEIAKELHGLDPYQYTRAYSPGLQEFIEAYTFYQAIKKEKLYDWTILNEKMCYKNENDLEEFKVLIQPMEFILGLADLSGEIMRRGVNSLNSGNLEICFDSNKSLQHLFIGYTLITGIAHNREIGRKFNTLRQSLLKTEMLCYNIKVRGKEAGKFGYEESVNSINYSQNDDDDDEGFY